MEDGFAHNIMTGVPVRVRKVIYTGHASTIFSVDSAAQILDQIGQSTRSEDVLPFALKLVEGEDCIEIAEDNNEFGCGDALARCLDSYEGYNVMVCVSRHVEGCFVSDMIQPLKIRAVKDAAISALDILFKQLKTEPFQFLDIGNDNPNTSSSGTYERASTVDRKITNNPQSSSSFPATFSSSSFKTLPVTKTITLDPFSNPIPAPENFKNKIRKGKLAKLQLRMASTR